MSASFEQDYKSYPTGDLVEIASRDPSAFPTEAIEAARAELLGRGVNWQDEQQAAADAKSSAAADDADTERTWSFLGPFLLLLPILAIPVGLLVYPDRKKVLKWGGIGLLAWVILFLLLVRFHYY